MNGWSVGRSLTRYLIRIEPTNRSNQPTSPGPNQNHHSPSHSLNNTHTHARTHTYYIHLLVLKIRAVYTNQQNSNDAHIQIIIRRHSHSTLYIVVYVYKYTCMSIFVLRCLVHVSSAHSSAQVPFYSLILLVNFSFQYFTPSPSYAPHIKLSSDSCFIYFTFNNMILVFLLFLISSSGCLISPFSLCLLISNPCSISFLSYSLFVLIWLETRWSYEGKLYP